MDAEIETLTVQVEHLERSNRWLKLIAAAAGLVVVSFAVSTVVYGQSSAIWRQTRPPQDRDIVQSGAEYLLKGLPSVAICTALALAGTPDLVRQASRGSVTQEELNASHNLILELHRRRCGVTASAISAITNFMNDSKAVEEGHGFRAAAGSASELAHRCFLPEHRRDVLLHVQHPGRFQPVHRELGHPGVDDRG